MPPALCAAAVGQHEIAEIAGPEAFLVEVLRNEQAVDDIHLQRHGTGIRDGDIPGLQANVGEGRGGSGVPARALPWQSVTGPPPVKAAWKEAGRWPRGRSDSKRMTPRFSSSFTYMRTRPKSLLLTGKGKNTAMMPS